MDPISLAAQALYADLRVFLSAPAPGQTAHAVARVSVSGTQITDLHKALRQFENDESNTYPFLLLAFDLTDERDFLTRASAQLRADERSIRNCLAQVGVTVAPVELSKGPLTIPTMLVFLQRLSDELSPHLGGIVVGLLPPRVDDVALRDRIAEALTRIAKHPALTVLLLDDGSDRLAQLAPHRLALEVDERALWKFLRAGKGQHDAGPPRADAPKLAPDERRAMEQQLGRRLPSEDSSRVLRNLLLDAGEAYTRGELQLAAKKFRMARSYCQLLGLESERAMCAVSVGSARFLLGEKALALRAFEEGRELARRCGAPSVVVQAELGIAATHMSLRGFAAAREAYARCAAASEGNPAMQVECLRMRGHTFGGEQRNAEATEAWLEALATVEKLAPLSRGATSYKLVGAHLTEALPALGRAQDVPSITARLRAIDDAIHAATREALESAIQEAAP